MKRDYADRHLEERIAGLHAAIKAWAQQNELWQDVSFERVVKSFDMERGAPTVAALSAGGHFADVVIWPGMGAIHEAPEDQGLSDECKSLMESRGFYGEPFDEGRLNIVPLEHHDKAVFGQFREYMRWKWICSLIQGDFDALNAEMYQYFGKNVDQLTRLTWREFEILVAELLQARGFQAELGPGSGDGGVDVRLVQRDPIGDILTLVQVKRYRVDRRIELQAVQALYGAEVAYGAQGSMFITTSDYQPAAMRFAGRENVRMDLYISDDVRNWCNDASAGIIEDRTRITTDAEIVRAVREARDNPSRVMHAVCGHTMCYNRFCLVLKESAASGLVIDVPSRIIQHDGYKQAGTEVPDLSDEQNVLRTVNTVRRVRKLEANSSFRFSDVDQEREFFAPWNQEPALFYGD